MKKIIVIALAALVASPALAHVTFTPGHVDKGAAFTGAFSTGHGCGNAPTTELRVTIPDGITVVRGLSGGTWTVTEQRTRGAVSGLVYKTSRPKAESEQVRVELKAPNAGGTYYFPVVQICGSAKAEWTEIPAPGASGAALKNPAPSVHVGPMSGGGEHDHAHH